MSECSDHDDPPAVPGGLGIANVFACALFAAMAGSSPATCSAIGSAGIPEMRKRGYSPGFAAGIIAAGGTLGILLPPSITMILYAVAAEQSLGRLFLAGIFPGVLLVGLFAAYAAFRHPAVTPLAQIGEGVRIGALAQVAADSPAAHTPSPHTLPPSQSCGQVAPDSVAPQTLSPHTPSALVPAHELAAHCSSAWAAASFMPSVIALARQSKAPRKMPEIGRASCRERV